jgi:hypothetical protein
MKYARGLALLALAGCVSAAAAAPPYLPVAGLDGISIDTGFGFRRSRHSHVSVYLSGGFGLGYSPYAYGPAPTPAFGVVRVYSVPSTVLVPVPPPLPFAPLPLPLAQGPPPFPPEMEGPPPGQAAGGFRALAPADRPQEAKPRERPRPPAELPAPKPAPPKDEAPKAPAPPKEEAPKPKPAPRPPPQLPPAPRPELDPKDENARQVGLGTAAFAMGQYGRAAYHFRLALGVAPGEPDAHFLLGQALFALGKYPEATAAVHEGLRLRLDWPTRPFRPLELYGDNVADYPEHLARLEEALGRNPDDPVLLFLFAYQLWFDGRQEEAVPLFERAARLLPDRTDSERFLRARPPGMPMV